MDRKNLGIECKIGLALIILVFIQASYGLQYEWKNWSGWSECNCFQSTNTDSVCTKNASRWRRQQTCVDKDTNDELTNCSYIPYEVEQCDKICNIQNKTETSPICKWSREWGNWSDCDYLYGDCGSGYQYQYPENCKCEDKIVQNKTLCGLTPIKARFCFDGCQGTCREIGHDTEAKRYEQTTRTTTFYNLTMDFTNRNTHVSIIRMELSMEVPCTYIDVIQKGVLINQYLLKEFKKSQYVEVYADQINMTMCLPFSTIYYFICDAPTYRDPIKPAACIRPGIGCGKNGTRTNMRSCVSRLNKVINNTFCYGVAQQVESCQVPCYNWGLWSQCVGCGHRATRSRKCYTDQAIDPHASDEGIVPNEMCVKQTKDESSYEELCFNDLEPCYDLRTWTQWSKINETTMTKQRNRTCIENGVKAVDMRMCNETKTMEYIEITSWTYWTHCGDPCLNIERMERTRDCIYNGQVNNTLCSDETLAEYRTCPPRECIKEDKANYTITINKTGCSVSCGLGTRTVTKTCIKNGTEEVLPSFCGIKDTATSMEECNMKQCVDILVPTYSVKISKSNCSGECGIGFRSITIKCLRDYNGKNESVDLELCGVDKNNQNKTEVCQLSNECKEESKWGSWTGTNDQCSTSCGGGRIRQRRLCLTGQNCIGDEARDIDCNENIPCPVDGGFTSWTNWTVCSTTCGSGLRMRVRECSNPSPLYGGKKCVGVTNETIKCNNKEQCSGTYVSSFGETCNLTCVDRGLVCVPFERKSEIEIQEIFKETFKQGCNNVTIQNVVDIETYGLVYMDRSGIVY
ncbi:A disintegrin and metalloproteinase with thrombospondin motifs gon-1-like [Clytia hemisphaerica]|uniref:Uncharacterized protein n=1 Tax=Clytia hemisphaerica TaxID=252671 RepID=A0A7M5WZZ9_9CNID